jgi:signal transduction histidine kinase
MKRLSILATALIILFVFSVCAFGNETATREECIQKAKQAGDLFKKIGKEAALKQINDRNGPFVWKDTYVFVFETDSCVLVGHPIKPALIGKSLIGMRDFNGKLFFVEMIDLANSKAGKGWVEYMWPKPGEDKPSQKASYVYRVPGTNIATSAGIYQR